VAGPGGWPLFPRDLRRIICRIGTADGIRRSSERLSCIPEAAGGVHDRTESLGDCAGDSADARSARAPSTSAENIKVRIAAYPAEVGGGDDFMRPSMMAAS
jgi:hypothetical protein